jgi:ankyrin repeat protein
MPELQEPASPARDAGETGFAALNHAMIRAAKRGQADKVASMLAQGASAKQLGKDKKDALDHAIEARCVECLRLLAPVSNLTRSRVKGETPLTAVAKHGWLAGLEILLPLMDPNAADSYGDTALGKAARHGWAEGVRRLLPVSDASHKNLRGETALWSAAAVGARECVELLIPASDLSVGRNETSASLALTAALASGAKKAVEIAQALHNAMSEEWRGLAVARALRACVGGGAKASDAALAWAAERADFEQQCEDKAAPDGTLANLALSSRDNALRAALHSPFFDSWRGQETLVKALEELSVWAQSSTMTKQVSQTAVDLIALRLPLGHEMIRKLLLEETLSLPGLRAREESIELRTALAQAKTGAENSAASDGAPAAKPAPRL